MANDDVFPPPHIQAANEQLAVWELWWDGNPDALSGYYSNIQPKVNQRTGIINRIGSFFWSRGGNSAYNSPEEAHKEHVPLAAEIAQKSANLLFGEMPQVEPGKGADGDTAALGALLDTLVDDGMHATLREAAEHCAALGGVYLRVVWDQEVRELPWLSLVHPSRAIPEWRWDQLRAVTFWEVVHQDDKRTVRLLERHDAGRITYTLWEGDKTSLGIQIPLTDYDSVAYLADLVDADGGIDTGTERLTAVYVPNMKPNKVWSDMPACRNLGRSDFSGIEPLLDNLDAVWSDWYRDMRLGKARILVSPDVLDNLGRGNGALFDTDREVFMPLDIPPTEDGKTPIEQVQFKIRTDDHRVLFETTKEQAVTLAGYSIASFGSKGDAAMTATEVQARTHQTNETREAKISYWRTPLEDILRTLVEIAGYLGAGTFDTSGIAVTWPEANTPSPQEVSQQLLDLTNAQAISTYRKVEMLHPTWDEDQINEEVDRIRTDTPAPTGPPNQELPNAA